jgi:hypothetical protein
VWHIDIGRIAVSALEWITSRTRTWSSQTLYRFLIYLSFHRTFHSLYVFSEKTFSHRGDHVALLRFHEWEYPRIFGALRGLNAPIRSFGADLKSAGKGRWFLYGL